MTIKAMLVDDEPFAREDLRYQLLQHPEIEVKWEAATMAEARNLLATHCPEVIFLDIELRGGSGFDLIANLDVRKTRIIVVTGINGQEQMAEQFGALDCLSKPVMAGNLARALEKLQDAMGDRNRQERLANCPDTITNPETMKDE